MYCHSGEFNRIDPVSKILNLIYSVNRKMLLNFSENNYEIYFII